MNWRIINHQENKIAQIEDKNILTIGNNENCDIIIQSSEKTKIYCQVLLHDGFIFDIRDEKVNTFFLKKNLTFFSQKIDFFYEQNDNFFLSSLLDKDLNISCFDLFLFSTNGNENLKFLFSDYEHKTKIIEENFKQFKKNPEIIALIYQQITHIYSLDIFKKTLAEVQNQLSQNSILRLEAKTYHYFDIVETACCYLDTFFWEKHCIFSEENIYLFKKIIWCVCAQIVDYGIITLPLYDEGISEILINHAKKVYFEGKGQLKLSPLIFSSDNTLMTLIERICTSVGRKIDESTPYCDARLPNGARVHAIIPPLSLNGPCLTIRKFPKYSIDMKYLVNNSSLTQQMADLLKGIVQDKKNILISGGTGTGKTTFLNCLSSFIGRDERIITIEDSAELQLQQPHVIRLETRSANSEKMGKVTMRELLKNALRMRPDRIVIGECRGEEALDMLQAMNTGHDGSMTTIHSNSAKDALRRLETLVMYASQNLPSTAIREQMSTAIHFIIQLTRRANGMRCVESIHSITALCEQSKTIKTKCLYECN
ncbi:CpaF family protein [Fluviispira vulneris]|uniref:CpaF family protein n=1 Tax=Fluviispira vulneris TaxID=2763012 RepID=UPI0016484C00|nr:CpaF family protein [Fluviispira vulneris]